MHRAVQGRLGRLNCLIHIAISYHPNTKFAKTAQEFKDFLAGITWSSFNLAKAVKLLDGLYATFATLFQLSRMGARNMAAYVDEDGAMWDGLKETLSLASSQSKVTYRTGERRAKAIKPPRMAPASLLPLRI